MALVVHPYIMGMPHRLHYFREALAHIRAVPDVIFTSGCEICTAFQTGVGETI
jgi:allantoinase